LKVVEELAARGLTLDRVARSLGISLRTLQRKKRELSQFGQALEDGHATAVATMSNRLWEMAMNGDVTAAIFWLRARAGWRDSDAAGVGVNVNSGAGTGGPSAEVERARIEQQTQLIGQLTVPERKQYLELLRRAVLRQASQDAPAALPEPGEPPAGQSAPAVRSSSEQQPDLDS